MQTEQIKALLAEKSECRMQKPKPAYEIYGVVGGQKPGKVITKCEVLNALALIAAGRHPVPALRRNQ